MGDLFYIFICVFIIGLISWCFNGGKKNNQKSESIGRGLKEEIIEIQKNEEKKIRELILERQRKKVERIKKGEDAVEKIKADEERTRKETVKIIKEENQKNEKKILNEKRIVNTMNKIVFNEEKKHLLGVLSALNEESKKIENLMPPKADFSGVMEESQRMYEVEKNAKIVDIKKELKNIESLKNRPYYARIDLLVDGEENPSINYIGACAFNIEGYLVSSVWSEVGSRYRAKNILEFKVNSGITYQILKRRIIDIKSGNLVECHDEYSIDNEFSKNSITDPFLLKILHEKKGDRKLSDIIRTIQLNQNDIIEYDFNKSLIVQGCAGSGKTMILLHRLANILFNKNDLNLKKIKIITPSEKFIDYIDELSKFLKLEEIEKNTIEIYYQNLLFRYGEKTNKCQPLSDYDIDYDLLVYVYSNNFISDCEKNIELLKVENDKKNSEIDRKKKDKYLQKIIQKIIEKIIREKGFKIKINHNARFCLYARLVFYYLCKGKTRSPDTMLHIDEGQDISKVEYELLKKINPGIIFNIYGDTNQLIRQKVGINNWENFSKETAFFLLNENYRNTREITNYCNKMLNINSIPIAIDGNKVLAIEIDKFNNVINSEHFNKRIAIIAKDNELLEKVKLNKTINLAIKNGNLSCLTVAQAKGFEFDKVYVFVQGMNRNEKYISFTRTLNDLIIIAPRIPLIYESGEGNLQNIKKILDSGVNIDEKDYNLGITSLMIASARGHFEIAKELINRGADINMQSIEGKTALFYAKNKEYYDIVNILKEAGAKE
ncbi:MAG: ankyrin repeat domain-containing protein [Candidatus Paceibacterota bacterium]|jgi:DNA helicase IV